MTMLGIVVGLRAEARLAAHLGRVEIGGGLPAGAEAAAERLCRNGADALLSFGLAGGLDPALRPGDRVVPEAVLEDGQCYMTDPALNRRFGGPTTAQLLAGRDIVAGVAAKQALWQRHAAAAIDLESGAVARVARRHGLPFAVLRAICDPAGRDLPPAALIALDAAGGIGPLRVLTSILVHPGQIPSLIALARDANAARRTLLQAVRANETNW
jgi:adenosylhomocysteine nucleosidase